jgi:hypothetical protein
LDELTETYKPEARYFSGNSWFFVFFLDSEALYIIEKLQLNDSWNIFFPSGNQIFQH